MNQHFCEKAQTVQAFLPVDLGAGANTGAWVSMKNYNRCAVVIQKKPGVAGNDPTITMHQATVVAGSDTKPLNINRVDKKQAATNLTTTGQFTISTPAAPATDDTFSTNTWTNSDLAEQAATIVIDFEATDLDIANGFCCLQVTIADVGTLGEIASVEYILHEPRYPKAILDSAIVD